MTVAAKQGLQVITGDVGGVYLNDKCAEKVWTYTLDENELPDKNNNYVTIIIQNLYGLKSGARTYNEIKGRNTVLDKDKDKDYDSEDTDLLNEMFHRKYLQLVGILNWLSELGRVDITYLSTYNASPRIIHWEALRHIFGYLIKHHKYALPVDPSPFKGEPGMPIEVKNFDSKLHLFKKLYPDAHEDIDVHAIPVAR